MIFPLFQQEAWYVKGQENKPACGYLELRLRYVRMQVKATAAADNSKTPAKKAWKSEAVAKPTQQKGRNALQQKEPQEIFSGNLAKDIN